MSKYSIYTNFLVFSCEFLTRKSWVCIGFWWIWTTSKKRQKNTFFFDLFLYGYFRICQKKCYFSGCRESGHRLPLSPLPRPQGPSSVGTKTLQTSLLPPCWPPRISKKSPFRLQKRGLFFYLFCKILSLYWFLIPMDDIEKSTKIVLFYFFWYFDGFKGH